MRNCSWHSPSRSQWNLMSLVAFVLFGVIFPLTTPSVSELFVRNGVGGLFVSHFFEDYLHVDCFASAPSSASVVEDITCFIMCAMFNTVPFLEGFQFQHCLKGKNVHMLGCVLLVH